MAKKHTKQLCCNSPYVGVTVHGDKFDANITINYKVKYLGRYVEELEAALAYDRAALKYHGDSAKVNFTEEETPQVEGIAWLVKGLNARDLDNDVELGHKILEGIRNGRPQ